MRLFFTLFALYLLALSCSPCSDSQECSVAKGVAIAASIDQQHHEHQDEACTPFCTCSCCAAPFFFPAAFRSQVSKPAFSPEKFPGFSTPLSARVQRAIWQPPRLS